MAYSLAQRNQHIVDACAWIATGRTLADYCRRKGSPTRKYIYEWMRDDPAMQKLFEESRDAGHDVIADECLAISNIEPKDAVQAHWRRIQIDTRLKLLAKWNPKKYGDRTSLDHAGGVNITVITGVPQSDASRSIDDISDPPLLA